MPVVGSAEPLANEVTKMTEANYEDITDVSREEDIVRGVLLGVALVRSPCPCRNVYLYSSFAKCPDSERTVVNTSDDVGGVRGYDRPSLKSSRSSKTVSSELEVADEDIERAGVDAVEEAAEPDDDVLAQDQAGERGPRSRSQR